MNRESHPSSFRDPNGFLFNSDGLILRQVNLSYRHNYDKLIESGLYKELTENNLLLEHEETSLPPPQPESAYKVIQPEQLAFISYPYEWSFSQLKDAALLTLNIQKKAVRYGMSLKDSSAYNIQFHPITCQPIFIDTLSFEEYQEGLPWVAYRQFCQHFLAPLALMAHRDYRLSQLFRIYIDGVPLDLASNLLPTKTKLNFGLLSHIHLHASAQKKYAGKKISTEKSSRQMNKNAFLGMIDSLEATTKKLTWQPLGTEWGDYYQNTSYSGKAADHKHELVAKFLNDSQAQSVWDLGANTGSFSRLASSNAVATIAFDIDPAAVEKNYLTIKSEKLEHMVPLVLDLTNPSGGIGWGNQERMSLQERGPVDMLMALALIHHLAISNNLPFEKIADYFSQLGRYLIIEFVPKEDSQVQRLLASRKDIFANYHEEGFEAAFSQFYEVLRTESLNDSERKLYLLKAK